MTPPDLPQTDTPAAPAPVVEANIMLQGRQLTLSCPAEERAMLDTVLHALEQRMTTVRAQAQGVTNLEKVALITAINLMHEILQRPAETAPVPEAVLPPAAPNSIDEVHLRRRIDSMNNAIDQALLEQNRLF